MPADALYLNKLAAELNSVLQGGRIDKITMPEKDCTVLFIRANKANHQLLICAAPSLPRIHLTNRKSENPAVAPSFLMHLRKHISGASILAVESVPYERVIHLRLLAKNELGVESKKTLTAEIMGKYSNIMLVSADGKISDCARHIGADTSSKRLVLPGVPYALPPGQNKCTPDDAQALKAAFSAFSGGRLDNFVLSVLSGLAPIGIKQAVVSAFGSVSMEHALTDSQKDALIGAIAALYTRPIEPCVLFKEKRPADFYLFPYPTAEGEYNFYDSLNSALEDYYLRGAAEKEGGEKTKRLAQGVKNAVARTEKKLAGFLDKELSCQDYLQDKLYGELLTANLYRLKTGQEAFETENYTSADYEKVVIPLDKQLTPQQNAQRYYKKYAKKKKTLDTVKQQSALARDELDYYMSIEAALRLAKSQEDVEELTEELTAAGLLNDRQRKGKQKNKKAKDNFLRFSVDGYTVKIGKNNVQNDALVKSAHGGDLWLHTQKIHGSHAVIENGGSAPLGVVEKAACLCAFRSKAYGGENVPVDYTLIKFVSKPSGAPPGKVVYTNQKTLYVTPRENL